MIMAVQMLIKLHCNIFCTCMSLESMYTSRINTLLAIQMSCYLGHNHSAQASQAEVKRDASGNAHFYVNYSVTQDPVVS